MSSTITPEMRPYLGNEVLYDRPAVQREFAYEIAELPVKILAVEPDINLPRPADDAIRSFLNEQYSTDTTFYIASEQSDRLSSPVIDFEILDASENAPSFHSVFFGILHMGDGSELKVAVKPHELASDDRESRYSADHSCLTDYFTNVAAKKANVGNLEPVGFIIGKEGTPFSLTVIEESLSTFDSIDWTIFFREGDTREGMQELWRKAAASMATLHSNGHSYHGDAATRNIATNPHGQVFLIDWEFGNVTNVPSPDTEERFGRSLVDLKKLMQDMARPTTLRHNAGIGLFTHSKENWWDGFKELFFDEYRSVRESHASVGNHRRQKIEALTDELDQLEATLEQMMNSDQETFEKVL